MQNHLLDEVLARHRQPHESEAAVIQRLRRADSRLTALYRRRDVEAAAAYNDPLIRSAYLLRYLPHYTLQIGDLLRDLEGIPEVALILGQSELRHVALCGGPAPEPIALALLHAQAGGQRLRTTVLDRMAEAWSDCWPISASTARAFSGHSAIEIDGAAANLADPPEPRELELLADCQLLTLMNALNELMGRSSARLEQQLEARLAVLPPGALVLISDQARYDRCQEGMALLRSLLLQRGARLLIDRTSRNRIHVMGNRFRPSPRLRNLYGQSAGAGGPATRHYRIWNRQLQLAALLPD